MSETSQDQNSDPKKGSARKWLQLINIPVMMGLIVFLFAQGGIWLDKKYPNPDNNYVKILTLIGVAIAMYNVHRQLQAINKSDKK